MKHHASSEFWRRFEDLPPEAQALARSNFELLRTDPKYPSLHFKKIGPYWFVRVGSHYRALGIEVGDGILWAWIGSHADYDKMTS